MTKAPMLQSNNEPGLDMSPNGDANEENIVYGRTSVEELIVELR